MDIETRRSAPRVRGLAVLAGILLALAISSFAQATGAPAFGVAATFLGIGSGGFLAGKLATARAPYHGVLVGVGWIVLEIVGLAPAGTPTNSDALADTVVTIASDVLVLLAAFAGGYLSRPR